MVLHLEVQITHPPIDNFERAGAHVHRVIRSITNPVNLQKNTKLKIVLHKNKSFSYLGVILWDGIQMSVGKSKINENIIGSNPIIE
jgi:hypothetical protein